MGPGTEEGGSVAGSARGGTAPARRRTASATRDQVIDAAIACILEMGFYRASSNAIARRAGVTWGVIQYHFGTRQALMVAVVEELNRRFTEAMAGAEIRGETLAERVRELYDLLESQYGDVTYLARFQTVLNLQHDPDTSAEVERALARQARVTRDHIWRLLRDALGDRATPQTALTVLHAIRGFVVSHHVLDVNRPRRSVDEKVHIDPGSRERFVTGLVAMAGGDGIG